MKYFCQFLGLGLTKSETDVPYYKYLLQILSVGLELQQRQQNKIYILSSCDAVNEIVEYHESHYVMGSF